MTRGGKRSPVGGRPKSTDETKTTNLCGVRVEPSRLAAYQETARRLNVPFSAWVTAHLDKFIHPGVIAELSLNGPPIQTRWLHLDSRGPATTERYDKPKKRKGRKS